MPDARGESHTGRCGEYQPQDGQQIGGNPQAQQRAGEPVAQTGTEAADGPGKAQQVRRALRRPGVGGRLVSVAAHGALAGSVRHSVSIINLALDELFQEGLGLGVGVLAGWGFHGVGGDGIERSAQTALAGQLDTADGVDDHARAVG